MKKIKKALCVLLSLSFTAGMCACSANKTDIASYFDSVKKISYAETYNEISEKGKNKASVWRDGMISGNGIQGVVAAGSPYNDTLIYQNMHFIMPNQNIRYCPDTSAELEEVRRNIVNGKDIVDNQSYDDVYMFHPGAELRIKQDKQKTRSYFRYTNYETAETGVVYTDKNGEWKRSTFTSQADDVTITKISESSAGAKLNLRLSMDEISAFANYGGGDEVNLKYKKLSDESGTYLAFAAHYPEYSESELKAGGYSTVAYIVCEGGSKALIKEDASDIEQYAGDYNPVIDIKDADNVYIIAASDRTDLLGNGKSDLEAFETQAEFKLVDDLIDKTKSVADKYSENGVFDYDKALSGHTEIFTPQYNAVEFTLNDETAALSNEALIKNQKGKKSLNSDLLEKAYYSGRYAQLCSSGVSTQRLYGMWIGEWCAGWGSKYTMDANVNLQTSSMNTSNISSAPVGYVNFILRQVDDWEENAKATHGFDDAIQAPVHTDGEMAGITESCYPYPFRYWNAGADWMLQPIFETLQCYGDMQIPISDEFNLYDLKSVLSVTEEDLTDEQIEAFISRGYLDLKTEILLPLLIKSVNYWSQLLTPEYYTDANGGIHYEAGKTVLNEGETYCIVPSYSPENNPKNYQNPSTANCAIDISACRDNVNMLISVLKDVDENADVSEYENMLEKLPPYLYDETDALKEWATTAFEENNEHRHLSHLYLAWPLNETQANEDLRNSCIKAIENRESENEASHALVHRALIAARLKDSDSVNDALLGLMSEKIYYKSLMTNHHTNRSSAYCTDFAIGYLGIINESLVYSASGEIEILPALPVSGFEQGRISGLISRTRAEITNLEWDTESKTASVTIKSDVNQSINVSCGLSDGDAQSVNFAAGEEKTIEFVF